MVDIRHHHDWNQGPQKKIKNKKLGGQKETERRTCVNEGTRSASRSLVAESCVHTGNTEGEGCVTRFRVQHKAAPTEKKNEKWESNSLVRVLFIFFFVHT